MSGKRAKNGQLGVQVGNRGGKRGGVGKIKKKGKRRLQTNRRLVHSSQDLFNITEVTSESTLAPPESPTTTGDVAIDVAAETAVEEEEIISMGSKTKQIPE